MEDELEVGGYRKLTKEENKIVKDINDRKALIMMDSTLESDVRGNRIAVGRSRRCLLLRYRLENDFETIVVGP